MKISILSNTNLDTIIKKLEKKYDVFKTQGYGQWVQELVNERSLLYSFMPESIFIILDGEELFRGIDTLEKCKSEINIYFKYIENAIKNHGNITFFISNIDIPNKKLLPAKEIGFNKELEFAWYEKIVQLNEQYNNFVLFDLKNMIEENGRKYFYSFKMWYLGLIKYSIKGQILIEEQMEKLLFSTSKKKKKCLILDLDNTLWGGIIGEDGISGISLSEFKEGAIYRDFQKRIKDIKDTGVILAIVSKNNIPDAMEVIHNHTSMVLRENDFVSIKINWKNKVENIRELQEELNIGIDSMVVIDDNPVERASIKEYFKDIKVPEFPEDTSELHNFITSIYYENFFSLRILDEDKEKTKMYIENSKRELEKKQSVSLEEFYKGLNTKIYIRNIDNNDIARAAQLSQKTNQFNVTTKRYSEKDIESFINSSNYDVYIASVEDKFGDNGKVVLIILEIQSDLKVKIDTFLLSCRVMGRNIEKDIHSFLEKKLFSKGYKQIEAEFIPTNKNKPVENLFENLDYSLVSVDENGIKKYLMNIKNESLRNDQVFAELIEK